MIVETLLNQFWAANYSQQVTFVVSLLQLLDEDLVEGRVEVKVFHWGVERSVSVFFNKKIKPVDLSKTLFDAAWATIASIELGKEDENVYS